MLQPTGLAVLDRLGLAEAAIARGSRIDRLFGQAGHGEGRVVLDVRYAALGPRAGFGVGIHRASLFALLHAAVTDAAIPVETQRTVTGSTLSGDRRSLDFHDGTSAGPFDLVVDALGCRTPLAPPTGRALAYGALWASLDRPADGVFDDAALEQRYRAASTMAGVLPIGTPPGSDRRQVAFFWSLRADLLDAWRDRGLQAWKRSVTDLWPDCAALLDQIDTPDRLTFATYTHRTLRSPARPALIHIGDAWHSASPQLGQGANMALLDAWALALAVGEARDVATAIRHSVALRRRHVRLYQAMSALFTPVYQSDSRILPFVRDTVVGPLSTLWPATWLQAAMVSGLIGSPLGRLGIG